MNERKYELTSEEINYDGHILRRIRALRDFRRVAEGTLGGFVESEDNLSQNGDCWIFENARVYGRAFVGNDAVIYNNATVCGDAFVCGHARVYGNAEVGDYAFVDGSAEVFGNACISGDARLCGEARIERISDYIVFKNWWSSGRYFTWTRSNNMWRAGCFYGTGEELIAKAYKDSKESGREYERVVKYVERIIAEGLEGAK